jgi:capsular exopolysaccharide synthesis family protein
VYSLLQDPNYRATAEVLVRQPSTDSLFSGNAAQPVDPSRTLETEIRVINGPDVQAKVREELGLSKAPEVTATAEKDADVIKITASGGNARTAATAANAYANAYVDLKRQQAVDEVLAASREIQARIGDLQAQIDQVQGVERDALIQAQAVFRQKLGEAQVGGALNTGGARIVAPAAVPSSPASPKPVRNAVWAFSFGLVLGVGIAFLRDFLDDSVKTKEDLERATPGLSTVGLIPVAPGWKDTGSPRLLSLTDPRSATAEAFRTVRTAVQFLNFGQPVRTLQVTSPGTREGKTTTVANLAVAMAQSGQRVVVVCCDLRRPRIYQFFGVPNDVGLTSVMIGQVPLSTALHRVRDQPRLALLPSGPLPPNPSELLASRRAGEVLQTLRAEADIVILDCPPVLPVTDALVVSPHADASLLVCRAGVTSRKKMIRAVELMRQVDAPLVGTILNGLAADDSYGYGTYEYYRASDGENDGSPMSRKSWPRRSKGSADASAEESAIEPVRE